MIELFLDIAGLENLFQISNFGNLKRLKRISPHPRGNLTISEKIVKPHLMSNGYLAVNLFSNGSYSPILIHRLVAAAFIKNNLLLPIVNHKDSNRLNNHVNNLEWCTQKENIRHCIDAGRRPKQQGSTAPRVKLTEKQVLEIRELVKTVKQADIARSYGMDTGTICNIVNRKSWTHI